jgi:ceramide glucosyltransferase
MLHILTLALESVTTLLAIAGIAYFLAAIFAAQLYLRERRRKLAPFAPGVTIMKSLKGLDPAMLEAFRSHCRQSYAGPYEILFGVADAEDPAIEAVHQLQQEFPDHAIRLLVCPEKLGTNGKVSTLVQMEREARYDYLLVNDSDIFVSPRYLECVMACFAPEEGKPAVGLVTALYRGRAHSSLWSRFESLGIATDFQAGVLLSKVIEGGLHYGLGSTLAVHRPALEKAGGLIGLVDQLADDYEMGARVDKTGHRVVLCGDVVETSIPAYAWAGFRDHQLRWLRTVRDARPGGYFGLIFTHGFAWAVVNLIACGVSPLSVAILATGFSLRMIMAVIVGTTVLGDCQLLAGLILLPFRDLTQMGLWLAGLAGNTIVWRGERFALKNGKLIRKA